VPSHNESLPTHRLVTVVAIMPLAHWIIYLPKMAAVSYSRGGEVQAEAKPKRLACRTDP
jgi:hypothetical protein